MGDLVEFPNLLRHAVDVAYIQVCGNGTSTSGANAQYSSAQCRQLTGRWGQAGAFDLCSAQGPHDTLVGQMSYSVWNSANNATMRGDLEYTFPGYRAGPLAYLPPQQVVNVHVVDAPGQASTCRNLFGDLNETAEAYG